MDLKSGTDIAVTTHNQLLLPLDPPVGKTFDTFVSTGNEVAVQDVKRLCAEDSNDHRQIYLWGLSSSGKSHLLQSACRAVTARGGRSAWVPLSRLLQYGSEVLSDFQSLDLIGLDEFDAIAGSMEWQRALFDLINEARANHCRLVMAGHENPATIQIEMKDLPSRLMWGAVYRLVPLDDNGKVTALQIFSKRLGCTLADDALPYLLGNYPRELAVLMTMLERLSHLAKAQKRRITVPFIKEILSTP